MASVCLWFYYCHSNIVEYPVFCFLIICQTLCAAWVLCSRMVKLYILYPVHVQMKPENGDDAVDQQTEDQLLAEDELEGENLENFNKLTEYGINKNVARELIKIYETGMMLNVLGGCLQ